MNILINNCSNQPLYEQIEEQIKNQILSGELSEGDALPSMRVLAKDLKISIITTKRAYEDLERDGYIVSVTGKGSFVRGLSEEYVRNNIRFAIEELFDAAIDKAIVGNVSDDELKDMLEIMIKEKRK